MSSASRPMILELEAVSFSYDRGEPFIEGLGLSVGEGEFIGLLGANGSGKSTILRIGSGILSPRGGTVMLWGKPLSAYRHKDRAKLICYLPQTMDVSVPFTVRELVGMGLYPYDIPPAMTAEEAIELVGLGGKAGAHVTDLSGGERRRTFIAMTLLQGAGLLLLDEPLANLDIRYQIEMVRLLKGLRRERNISVVMALHDINMAFRFEKVMLIKDGAILGFGPPEDVLSVDLIGDAFGVTVSIQRSERGETFISYGGNP